MKQYEYKSVMVKESDDATKAEAFFNSMGADGWQLIFTIAAQGFPEVRCWFMREKE